MPCTGAVAHDVGIDALPDNSNLNTSFESYSEPKVQQQQQQPQTPVEQNGITSPKVIIPSSHSTPRVNVCVRFYLETRRELFSLSFL
jgi:hypothetical protein